MSSEQQPLLPNPTKDLASLTQFINPKFLFRLFVGLLVIASFMVVASAWLWVNSYYVIPVQDHARASAQIALDQGQILDILYPKFVPLNSSESFITLRWYYPIPTSPTQPALEVQIQIPNTLASRVSLDQPGPGQVLVSIPISSTSPAIINVPLINTGQLVNFSQRASLVFSVVGTNQSSTVEVSVESLARSQVKNLSAQGVFSEKSLPFYLVGALFSLAGAIFTNSLQRVADEKQKAEKKVKEFQDNVDAGHIPEARSLLRELEDLYQRGMLSYEIYDWIAQVHKISLGDIREEAWDIIQGRPNTAGQAILYYLSNELTQPKSVTEIQRFVLRLSCHPNIQDELRNRLERMLQQRGFTENQPTVAPDWPKQPGTNEKFQAPSEEKRKRLFATPDAQERGDQPALGTDSQLFWPLHPLYLELSKSAGVCLVWGSPGSGRMTW
jgi:hypothetical protein